MAEDIQVKYEPDLNGDTIKLKFINGRSMPHIFAGFSSIADFSARPDDVILTSYPRSGTHWLWESLMMTVRGDLSFQSNTKADAMLEKVGCEHLDGQKSPRVVNTHLSYSDLPPDIFRKKCKIVHIARNPKDVAVSFYHFIKSMKDYDYEGKIDGFLELLLAGKDMAFRIEKLQVADNIDSFPIPSNLSNLSHAMFTGDSKLYASVPYGGWFQYMGDWGKAVRDGSDCPIKVVYYEQLKKNFVQTMVEVGSFLGISRTEAFYVSMEENTAIEKIKRSQEEISAITHGNLWKKQQGFIRKGLIGDWKNVFTVAQSEKFDELYRKHLSSFPFHFDFD